MDMDMAGVLVDKCLNIQNQNQVGSLVEVDADTDIALAVADSLVCRCSGGEGHNEGTRRFLMGTQTTPISVSVRLPSHLSMNSNGPGVPRAHRW
ncbi:hypothetical protein QQ045_002725 [Rhodiola kirilowii]